MGVRVRLAVRIGSRSVVIPALVNSGYEADSPELSIPVSVAEELGGRPHRPS